MLVLRWASVLRPLVQVYLNRTESLRMHACPFGVGRFAGGVTIQKVGGDVRLP